MDISQLPYLAAILTAGLSKKETADVDLAQADWTALMPYLVENDLLNIASVAFKVSSTYFKAAAPHSREVCDKAVANNLETVKCSTTLMKLAMEWAKDGNCMLGVGGLALGCNYPVPGLRGGRTLVCTTLMSDKTKANAADFKLEEYDFGPLHVCRLSSLVPQGDDEASAKAAAVLEEAFFSAPCRKYVAGALVPNAMFTALYLLNGAYSQITEGTMSVRVVIDWAMVLYAAGVRDKDFDWADFTAKCEAMGILNFAKVLTASAVRLTGVDVPEGAKSLNDAKDSDVELLLGYALEPTPPAETTRWEKFTGILRHHKKYSRVMGVSPIAAAFRALFK